MGSRTAGRLLLALTAIALLMKALPAASEGEEPAPSAEALLRQSLRLYSEARTLQLRGRTVLKIEPPERRVTRIGRYENNHNAGLVESGGWVAQSDYRLARGQAYRFRYAEYGMDGECLVRVPGGRFLREYWNARDLPHSLIAPNLGIVVRYQDGTQALADQGHLEPTINLPVHLFLFTSKEAFFDPLTATLAAKPGGGEAAWVSLRVQARHTVLRAPAEVAGFKKPVKKFRFGKGEWILRLDPTDFQIRQVDIHEEWPALRPGAPDGVVDLRETYTDQLLNGPLTLEDFFLEPPDPVPAANLKDRDAGIGKDWEPKARPEGEPAGTPEKDPS